MGGFKASEVDKSVGLRLCDMWRVCESKSAAICGGWW